MQPVVVMNFAGLVRKCVSVCVNGILCLLCSGEDDFFWIVANICLLEFMDGYWPVHGNETVTKIEKYYLCYVLYMAAERWNSYIAEEAVSKVKTFL